MHHAWVGVAWLAQSLVGLLAGPLAAGETVTKWQPKAQKGGTGSSAAGAAFRGFGNRRPVARAASVPLAARRIRRERQVA
jgi:hypothetical protein